MHDLVISNGAIVSDGVRRRGDVAVDAGIITAVAAPGTLDGARVVIDAAGKWVLPGAIDIHFHCRAPSHPERGDFASESRAAIAGGVTTIFEMPISDPACSTPEVLRARRALAEQECYAHFALYAGGGLRDPAAAAALVDAGAIGFKIFTTTPPRDRRAEFDGLCAEREDAILAALRAIAPTGRPCVFHAENQPLIEFFGQTLRHGVPDRPPLVEATAIAIIGTLARETGARAHIAHLTSAAGLQTLRAINAAGPVLTAETCPQYLLFDSRAIDRWGGYAKIAPPLREPADSAALWEGLRDGAIGIVASDHAPFRPEEKRDVPYADAPQGMPSVETMLPVLLDAAARGLLPLEQAVDLLTGAPARLFGLDGRKGTVAAGADADLVIVDPAAQAEVRIDCLLSRAAGCAILYDGLQLRGRIETTLVAGQIAYRDGRIEGPPRGRFIAPVEAAAPRAEVGVP